MLRAFWPTRLAFMSGSSGTNSSIDHGQSHIRRLLCGAPGEADSAAAMPIVVDDGSARPCMLNLKANVLTDSRLASNGSQSHAPIDNLRTQIPPVRATVDAS